MVRKIILKSIFENYRINYITEFDVFINIFIANMFCVKRFFF